MHVHWREVTEVSTDASPVSPLFSNDVCALKATLLSLKRSEKVARFPSDCSNWQQTLEFPLPSGFRFGT